MPAVRTARGIRAGGIVEARTYHLECEFCVGLESERRAERVTATPIGRFAKSGARLVDRIRRSIPASEPTADQSGKLSNGVNLYIHRRGKI